VKRSEVISHHDRTISSFGVPHAADQLATNSTVVRRHAVICHCDVTLETVGLSVTICHQQTLKRAEACQLALYRINLGISVGPYCYLVALQYYVDAAYCYRRSSVVCRSICLSVTSRAKTAEPIEMPFVLWTRVGPRNIGTTWRIRPNLPCAAAMQLYVKLL